MSYLSEYDQFTGSSEFQIDIQRIVFKIIKRIDAPVLVVNVFLLHVSSIPAGRILIISCLELSFKAGLPLLGLEKNMKRLRRFLS